MRTPPDGSAASAPPRTAPRRPQVKFEGMPDAPQHDSTSLALNHNTAFNPNASHAKSRSITGHFDHVGVPTHGKIYLDD